MTIVGVVANVRSSDPSIAPKPQIFMPFQQHPFGATALSLVLRTASPEPLVLAQTVAQTARAVNGDVPVRVTTMEATLGEAVAAPRFRTLLLGLFAAVALLLAMAGVYGVVSFTVSQRTSELGLRVALGAQRREIVALTLASGVRPTVIGVVIGWVAALAATRVIGSMLFATSEHDPVVFVAVPALLVGVAVIASMAPALRAARVDPVIALRAE
jgi:ABC-type lipoprotein release transport system permease subunit